MRHCILKLLRYSLILYCSLSLVPYNLGAQLLEDEYDEPDYSTFARLGGKVTWLLENTERVNGVLTLSGYSTLNKERSAYAGLTIVAGGMDRRDLVYIGPGFLYSFGSEPDFGLFVAGDAGFAQIFNNITAISSPLSSGFGSHILIGFSVADIFSLPPLQIAVSQGYFKLNEEYAPIGIQITAMF